MTPLFLLTQHTHPATPAGQGLLMINANLLRNRTRP